MTELKFPIGVYEMYAESLREHLAQRLAARPDLQGEINAALIRVRLIQQKFDAIHAEAPYNLDQAEKSLAICAGFLIRWRGEDAIAAWQARYWPAVEADWTASASDEEVEYKQIMATHEEYQWEFLDFVDPDEPRLVYVKA